MDIKQDDRGYLTELLSSDDIHIGISTIKPLYTRGQHYHKKKKERIILFTGIYKVTLYNVKTLEIKSLEIKGPEELIIEPYIQHEFTNIGNTEGVIIFMQDCKYDRVNPDTYSVENF